MTGPVSAGATSPQQPPAHNVYIVRIIELPCLSSRHLVRNDAQDLAFQFTPAICIALSKLKEVDGTLKFVLSRIRINLGFLFISLDDIAGANYRVPCVVFCSNEC